VRHPIRFIARNMFRGMRPRRIAMQREPVCLYPQFPHLQHRDGTPNVAQELQNAVETGNERFETPKPGGHVMGTVPPKGGRAEVPIKRFSTKRRVIVMTLSDNCSRRVFPSRVDQAAPTAEGPNNRENDDARQQLIRSACRFAGLPAQKKGRRCRIRRRFHSGADPQSRHRRPRRLMRTALATRDQGRHAPGLDHGGRRWSKPWQRV